MSKNKFDELSNLKPGSFKWKIQVRIVRLWRGVSKTGEMFKGFNIILLDSKNNRIHDFVPANTADYLEPKIVVGKIKETEDDGKSIQRNAFDFYDHSDLRELTKQNTYLADVVGIIKHYQPLTDLVNRLGNQQKQVKFIITDGSSSVNVTFWDAFAVLFDKQMKEALEKPVIVIIASSRVGFWNDAVDLSSVGGTICYLNYNHYAVAHLRNKLTNPAFAQLLYAIDKYRDIELLNVANIKSLGKDYIMRQVYAHVKICNVDQTKEWYTTVCTECDQVIAIDKGDWFCHYCDRILPHPDKKFHVSTVASDATGTIELILGDQQIRTLIGKRAVQLLKEVEQDKMFPEDIKNLAEQIVTVKILIKEINVINKIPMYWATNICSGFFNPNENKEQKIESVQLTGQTSSSTYHLDGMSQLNFQSPMISKTGKE